MESKTAKVMSEAGMSIGNRFIKGNIIGGEQ